MPAVLELKTVESMGSLPVVLQQPKESRKRSLYSEPLVVFGILLLVALSTASVVLVSMLYHSQTQTCPAPPQDNGPRPNYNTKGMHKTVDKQPWHAKTAKTSKEAKETKENMNKLHQPRPAYKPKGKRTLEQPSFKMSKHYSKHFLCISISQNI